MKDSKDIRFSLTHFEKIIILIVALVAIVSMTNMVSESGCSCEAKPAQDNLLTAKAVIDTKKAPADIPSSDLARGCEERYYCKWTDLWYKDKDCSSRKVQECEHGCFLDSCKDPPEFCEDSDYGVDVNTAGSAEYEHGTALDTCVQDRFGQESSVLREQACDGENHYFVEIDCDDYGKDCRSGRCVDKCAPRKFCVGDDVYRTNGDCSEDILKHCEKGCIEGGICREDTQFCHDSDGGKEYFRPGKAVSSDGRASDSCEDQMTLRETYCSQGEIISRLIDCDSFGMMCYSGACRDIKRA